MTREKLFVMGLIAAGFLLGVHAGDQERNRLTEAVDSKQPRQKQGLDESSEIEEPRKDREPAER